MIEVKLEHASMPKNHAMKNLQRLLWQKSKKVKHMIYIAVLCNLNITAEPLYNTPLVHWTYAAANNAALIAWRPSQGNKLYCLVNRGTLGVNNLPRVVARIVPRSESNLQPLDHESNALPLHHRVTCQHRESITVFVLSWWIMLECLSELQLRTLYRTSLLPFCGKLTMF